jgi:argininosuccinate lyase
VRDPGESSRFRKPPDPSFWKLNRSLPVDRWLAPWDIRQSAAHAAELARLGVLDQDELHRITEGLEQIALEFEAGSFEELESDEDVHMAIERRLGELAGPAAGKIHTGRSRNDQVATDLALAVLDGARETGELLEGLMATVLARAREVTDWVMPGYTHLQRAQPVLLAHHLMAYFWMFERDRRRFAAVADEASVMPLGSGALAGVNWELDRESLAESLGFVSAAPNSIDGSSNRDFALAFLAASAICGTHLSRLGSEIVIWSSSEFGFCQLSEEFTSGSSIMPQKQNPDSAEILRGRAPGLVASFSALAGVLHGLPLTYNKDLQEDKVPLREAIGAITGMLAMADGMIGGIKFDQSALEEAAGDELLLATEVADFLVSRGIPFREAHGVTGQMVADCIASGRTLSELTIDELRSYSEEFDGELGPMLDPRVALEAKMGEGSTSPASLMDQLQAAEAALG